MVFFLISYTITPVLHITAVLGTVLSSVDSKRLLKGQNQNTHNLQIPLFQHWWYSFLDYQFIFLGASTSQSVPPANTPAQHSQPSISSTRSNYSPSVPLPAALGRLATTAISPSEEHSRVFHYMKGKTRMTGKGKAPIKKIPTCTMKFCCLGCVDSDKPPTSVAAKTALANSGLGPSSMTFEMNGNAIHSKLLERYPRLSHAGGYELLLYQRGGEEHGFHHLPAPHTPSRIKEIANASVVYIRPLQLDILDAEDPSMDNMMHPAQEVRIKT